MKNELGHKFSIRRVQKATDEEYIAALRIYNETTPFEIRTETNEITYWLSQNPDNELFVHIPFKQCTFSGNSEHLNPIF